MRRLSVGVDIGGTFTDLVCLDEENGQFTIHKVPSTPPTFVEGVMSVLRKAGLSPKDLKTFRHGSTIATNAIVERKGARTGVVTTKGFRDILEDARACRPEVFNLHWDPPPPLVPRYDRLGVSERMDYRGEVLEPLEKEEVKAAARIFRKRGVEAVAISFLNSFMNPSHELQARRVLEEELPGAFICTSSEVFPEMLEFERTSTTVANAYLGPILDRYLSRLTDGMRDWGYRGDILIIHSAGGVMTCDSARRIPARTCQSGPAAGVRAGAHIGALAGFPNVITFDMGGTSTDLSLVWRGEPLFRPQLDVEFNIPIRFPCVDVVSIGTGGGSIAWVDSGGTLKNGPQSAGAVPGPASYGRGGVEPTNTDANLVLGRLNPENFLGGEMKLDAGKAAEAIRKKVAEPFGMTVPQAADGILRVAEANMLNATKLISVVRGYDPRDFALVAFGGAGPMHAVALARDLSIPKVIVPRHPGVTSAFGTLRVDVRHDFIHPLMKRQNEIQAEELNRLFQELEEQARRTLKEEGISGEAVQLDRLADVKYYPQSRYLTIPVKGGLLKEGDVQEMADDYVRRFQQEFGYTIPQDYAEVEVVNLRLAATGYVPKGEVQKGHRTGKHTEALKGKREVFFREEGGFVSTPLYERARLFVGARVEGPAIIEQEDSTTVLPPGAKAQVDDYLNLIIEA